MRSMGKVFLAKVKGKIDLLKLCNNSNKCNSENFTDMVLNFKNVINNCHLIFLQGDYIIHLLKHNFSC